MEDFVWKLPKQKNGDAYTQDEIKMSDATNDQLKSWYEHCKVMLYNDSQKNPGRYRVLTKIKEQQDRCGAELFLRYLRKKNIPAFTFLKSVNEFVSNNAELIKEAEEFNQKNNLGPIKLSFVISECPEEFRDLPLDLVKDACLDRLGYFSKQHISIAFILRHGVWFTTQEAKDLTVKNENGEIIDKIDVVKERLNIRPEMELKSNPKGLNYSELRAMINLTNKKYSELTTCQLETLRNKILYSLTDRVNLHISQWLSRMKQIEMIADERGLML